MGLVYHNGKFVPEQRIKKIDEETELLRRLREFLDENEPGLVHLLVNLWNSQGKAITYKELREAILAGEISTKYLEEWMQDYSRLVADHMLPTWEKAIAAAAHYRELEYPLWHFSPMADGIQRWVKNHAAEFVTNVTTTQIEGLRAVVQRAAVLEDMTVDELARVIRPMVGLTKPQAVANMNYYETMRANGVSEKVAQEKAAKYAAQQSRQRAYNIARTEMADAYNQGAYEATKQAQAAGYMGKSTATWCIADDERSCKQCRALEGKTVDLDVGFNLPNGRKLPPAHPGCRCAYLINEVSPPL